MDAQPLRAVPALPDLPLGPALAATAASLVGIGLGRFAYTPLLPAIVEAGWLTPGGAAWLGAVNLAGHLAGALAAPAAVSRLPAAPLLRAAMLLTGLSCLACAPGGGFAWLAAWRFLAGAMGGLIMVLAATTVLPGVAPARRGLAGGLIFAGVGLGVAASGTLTPWLLARGIGTAWAGIGALALLLTTAAWRAWPVDASAPAAPGDARATAPARSPRRLPPVAAGALLLAYGLNAVGLVPHMVLLVDLVARGLGRGLAAGAAQWVTFGIGAVVVPLLAGRVADRIGFAAAIRLALALQAAAALLPVATTAPLALHLSSAVMGGFTPGITMLVLGHLTQRLPSAEARRLWSLATLAFGLFQALAGAGFAALIAAGDGHPTLPFAIAGAALGIALLTDLAAAAHTRRTPP